MQTVNAVKVINTRDAIAHLGISDRTFWRLVKRGDAPPKVRISDRRVGYRVSDLDAWLDARREQVAS